MQARRRDLAKPRCGDPVGGGNELVVADVRQSPQYLVEREGGAFGVAVMREGVAELQVRHDETPIQVKSTSRG
ncbi:MAG: hypothetical protein ABI601_15075, partial [bacterium]